MTEPTPERDEQLLAFTFATLRALRCPVLGCEFGVATVRAGSDRYWLACGARHRFVMTFAVLDPLLEPAERYRARQADGSNPFDRLRSGVMDSLVGHLEAARGDEALERRLRRWIGELEALALRG